MGFTNPAGRLTINGHIDDRRGQFKNYAADHDGWFLTEGNSSRHLFSALGEVLILTIELISKHSNRLTEA